MLHLFSKLSSFQNFQKEEERKYFPQIVNKAIQLSNTIPNDLEFLRNHTSLEKIYKLYYALIKKLNAGNRYAIYWIERERKGNITEYYLIDLVFGLPKPIDFKMLNEESCKKITRIDIFKELTLENKLSGNFWGRAIVNFDFYGINVEPKIEFTHTGLAVEKINIPTQGTTNDGSFMYKSNILTMYRPQYIIDNTYKFYESINK